MPTCSCVGPEKIVSKEKVTIWSGPFCDSLVIAPQRLDFWHPPQRNCPAGAVSGSTGGTPAQRGMSARVCDRPAWTAAPRSFEKCADGSQSKLGRTILYDQTTTRERLQRLPSKRSLRSWFTRRDHTESNSTLLMMAHANGRVARIGDYDAYLELGGSRRIHACGNGRAGARRGDHQLR